MLRRSHVRSSWAVMACLGMALGGCNKEEEAPVQQPVNTPRPVQNSGANLNGGNAIGSNANSSPEKVDPEAGYPAELAEWTDEDYRKARKINHSRLTFAIEEREKKSRDSAEDAKFWLELLEIKPLTQGREPDFTKKQEDPGASLVADNSNKQKGRGSTDNDEDLSGLPRVASMSSGGGGDASKTTGNANPTDEEKVDPALLGKGSAQEIVKALVDATLANKTSESLETLKALLSAKLANGTPDPAMVKFTMDGMQSSKRTDLDDLFMMVLLQPGELRPDDKPEDIVNPMSALDLQKEGFARLEGKDLAELKSTLARRIGDAKPDAAADPILTMLLEDKIENVPAQVVLYQSGEIKDQAKRDELRDLLASYSKSAFDRLMGLTEAPAAEGTGNTNQAGGGRGGSSDSGSNVSAPPPPPDEGTGPIGGGAGVPGGGRGGANRTRNNPGLRKIDLTDEQVTLVVNAMWTKEFEDTVLQQLDTAGNLDDAGDLMNLVGVLPMQTLRRRVASMIDKNWEDGVDALAERGIFTTIMHDPGMLLATKVVPTDRIPKNFDPTKVPSNPSQRTSFDENKKKYDWAGSTYEQVEMLMKLFAAAPGAKSALGGIKPPVQLYRGSESNVKVAFEAIWPDDIRKKSGDAQIDPLTVRYLRIESAEMLNAVKGHYNNKLRGTSLPLVNNGVWYSQSKTDAESGTTTSVDIFIKQGGGGGGGGGGGLPNTGGIGAGGGGGAQNQNVVVEILVIETPAIAD